MPSARAVLVGAIAAVAFVAVPAAADVLDAQGDSFSANPGQAFSGVVATFCAANPGAYTATIDWGDGSGTSSGQIAQQSQGRCGQTPGFAVSGSHTYAHGGSYQTTISITDTQGGNPSSGTAHGSANVAAEPTAAFTTSPDSPTAGQSLTFSGSAVTAPGTTVDHFEWAFGDSTPALRCGTSTPSASHVFADGGTFGVSFTVVDTHGVGSTTTRDIEVADPGATDHAIVAGSSCGDGAAQLAPGLRGAPSIHITAPEDLAYFDSAPSEVAVSGTVKAPEGIKSFCVTGPAPEDSIPAACNQKSALLHGHFTVPITGIKPGYSFIDAWVRDSVGNIAHDEIALFVANSTTGLDLRADSLEVTQGIQPNSLPDGSSFLPDRSPAMYQGVPLAAGGKTLVRFFADAPRTSRFPARDTVKGVGAALYGFRDGKSLDGSPLLPEEGLRDLGKGINLSFARGDNRAAYTFTLPSSWTSGNVKLVANVDPPDITPGIVQCTTCYGNDQFQMDNINFTPTRADFAIAPVKLTYSYGGKAYAPPDPATVFSTTRALTPLGDGQLVVYPYQRVVGIDDIANRSDLGSGAKSTATAVRMVCGTQYIGSIVAGVEASASVPAPDGSTNWLIPGTSYGPDGTECGASSLSVWWNGNRLHNVVVVNSNNPNQGVPHEVGHAHGLPHASTACGGSAGTSTPDPWPPDGRGLLGGVGIDRRGTTPGGLGPYAFHFSSVGGDAFDVMGYCANDKNSWISVRNWKRLIAKFECLTKPPKIFTVCTASRRSLGVAARRAVGYSAATGPTLHVTAFADASGVVIDRVEPQSAGGAQTAAPDNGWRAVFRDANRTALADVAMGVAADPHHNQSPTLVLGAEAPAPGAASVEIVRDGVVVARRSRSAHSPTVDAVRLSRKNVATWRAADADGDPLLAAVEFSGDAGRTWRTVYNGPSARRVALPRSTLTATKRGRVRVTVGDGFEAAVATSPPLVVPAAAPVVRILSPAARRRFAGDASIYLSGEAYEDGPRQVASRSLRWFAGRRALGRGARLSVAGLPPGTRSIRLVARGRSGLAGWAVVPVRIRPVTPKFLGLRAPKRISARARTVVIRVASTIPATLRIGGRRVALDRRARRIAVPARPGRSRLKLQLSLTSDRRTARRTVTVLRGG